MGKLDDLFTQKILKTRYTPSKIQVNPLSKHLVILEKEFKCFTEHQREIFKQQIYQKTQNEEYLGVDYSMVGYPRPRG